VLEPVNFSNTYTWYREPFGKSKGLHWALPHDGEFAEKSQITLRERSRYKFAIAISRKTAVLARLQGAY